MNIQESLEYFGSQSQLAKAANVQRQEVNRWVKRGYIPYKKQLIIEKSTNKKLLKDNQEKALSKERFNMHTKKNSMFNDHEDLIIDLYDHGVKITEIHKKINYGNYHTLRKFILNRLNLRKLKS